MHDSLEISQGRKAYATWMSKNPQTKTEQVLSSDTCQKNNYIAGVMIQTLCFQYSVLSLRNNQCNTYSWEKIAF